MGAMLVLGHVGGRGRLAPGIKSDLVSARQSLAVGFIVVGRHTPSL
jgi:hypothetical protein